MSVTDARRNFGKLLDRVERGERIHIARRGKPFVAFIPISDFRLLARAKLKHPKMAST